MKKANASCTLSQQEGEKASRRSSRSRDLDTSYIQCHTAKREMRYARTSSTLGLHEGEKANRRSSRSRHLDTSCNHYQICKERNEKG
jgi:hypothetical protein